MFFSQGGATAQFAAVPLNLVENIEIRLSGYWVMVEKAIKEAGAFLMFTVATSEADTYRHIPPEDGRI